MMQGLYTSSSGMMAHSNGLGVIGNNLANVSTVGFKQQMLLFQDLQSEDFPIGAAYEIETRQIGLGSMQGFSRTLFNEGALAAAENTTDLAIGGKGFFQVVDENNEAFYTRAGNFFIDQEGTMRNPGGQALMGFAIEDGAQSDELTEITINSNDDAIAINPPKATENATAIMNLYTINDEYNDPTNPYFSMIQSWDANLNPPISGVESNSFSFYDANGTKQTANLYFDEANVVDGKKVYEYVISMDPALDGRAEYANTASAGLLLAGTMTFSSSGELENINSFSPNGDDLRNPANWSLSSLNNGVPSLELTLAGQEPQSIQLNLGASGTSDAWVLSNGDEAGEISAADIGTNFSGLPGLTSPEYTSTKTTALSTSTSLKNLSQDGYAEGSLTNMEIDSSGTVLLNYTNGQQAELYSIPVFRFTSEDGLRREGDNLYSYSQEAGQMEYGTAGTENYGKIYSNTLEQSNVDMSREMVNMIVVQRGFQSNSKSVQAIDTMIQKAIEMKR